MAKVDIGADISFFRGEDALPGEKEGSFQIVLLRDRTSLSWLPFSKGLVNRESVSFLLLGFGRDFDFIRREFVFLSREIPIGFGGDLKQSGWIKTIGRSAVT